MLNWRFYSVLALTIQVALAEGRALVFQSDFGLGDGAVSAMQGVAYGVSQEIDLFDLSHEIPPYDIWIAALVLKQTAPYWPEGTVFVSVVDPGVGTDRKSVVLKTETGHFFVTPDNGTLTFVAEEMGVAEVREIDEAVNRRENSEQSYTFHGRDVYAYTGALLASGQIRFEDVGGQLEGVESLAHERAHLDGALGEIRGTVMNLDVRYGNVWTNIEGNLLEQLGVDRGGRLQVEIHFKDEKRYAGEVPYVATFGDVPEGEPLLYLNSLLKVSLALNMESFAEVFGISYGKDWMITLRALEESR
ncbi:MAG: S-adenosyl-l-methionine hydroxide adenosyltransferase family protein [Puniceicoccaceae bacterium]